MQGFFCYLIHLVRGWEVGNRLQQTKTVKLFQMKSSGMFKSSKLLRIIWHTVAQAGRESRIAGAFFGAVLALAGIQLIFLPVATEFWI